MSAEGWFADITDEEDRDSRWPWQPFIQTAGGCFPLQGVWFATEEECEIFIRGEIIGRGVLAKSHIMTHKEVT